MDLCTKLEIKYLLILGGQLRNFEGLVQLCLCLGNAEAARLRLNLFALNFHKL